MSIQTVLQAVNQHTETVDARLMHRDYFNGKHRLSFASPRFRQNFGWVLRSSIENLCPAVVYAHVDRLSIKDWGANIDDAARHGLNRLANLVHTEAFVTGDGFALTWYRPGTKERVATFHRADQVVPFVDPEQPDRLLSLVKLWVDPFGFARANVYDAETLRRFRSSSKVSFVNDPTRTTAPQLPTTEGAWTVFDEKGAPAEESHDFGRVPAVWWKRNPPSQYETGVSVLRDIVGPQDRLNKVNADSVVAAERIALPLRYVLDVHEDMVRPRLNTATGIVEPPKTPLDESRDSIMMLTNTKGPAGQFAGPDANHLKAMKEDLEGEIARISGVPAYYLAQTSGDVPSGESLRVVTSRLLAAVTTFQQDATPAWKGQLELLGFENPAIEWADAMPLDQTEKLANAEAKARLGYALADIVADLGETNPDEIVANATNMADQRAERTARQWAQGNLLSN